MHLMKSGQTELPRSCNPSESVLKAPKKCCLFEVVPLLQGAITQLMFSHVWSGAAFTYVTAARCTHTASHLNANMSATVI